MKFLLLACSLFTLAACGEMGGDTGGGEPVINNAPEISSFSASPETIAEGDSTTLSWTIEGDAQTLTLANDIDDEERDVTGETSVTVSPVEDTVYLLIAENSAGEDTATTTVAVTPADTSNPDPTPPAKAPVIDSFTATPGTLEEGQSSTLTWELSGGAAAFVTIDNGVGRVAGNSVEVSPTETTTYTLTVVNGSGENTSTATVSVTPTDSSDQAPVIDSFTATPNPANEGDEVTLSWQLSGGEVESLTVTDLEINEADPEDGMRDVTGEESTVIQAEIEEGGESAQGFRLTATNGVGTVTKELTLDVSGATVSPPPSNDLLEAADIDATEERGEFVEKFGSTTSIDPAYIFEESTYPENVDPEITLPSTTANGRVSEDDGTIFYTANDGYTGADNFEYILSATINGEEVSDSGTVRVKVP